MLICAARWNPGSKITLEHQVMPLRAAPVPSRIRSATAQDRLARILADGRGAPKNPVEATKWHLISKARGETDLLLDDFVNSLDAATRAAGEKAAKPWLDALKRPPS
jgi:TPR repeat protein